MHARQENTAGMKCLLVSIVEVLLLADFFCGASSLVDHLLNRILGVARGLIDLFTIPKTIVIGENSDSCF